MIENSREEDHNDDFKLSDLPWDDNIMGNREETRQKIFGRLKKSTTRNTIIRNISPKVRVAAAVLLLFVPTVYFIWQNSFSVPAASEYAGNFPENAVIPGGDKARLVLGDGSVVVLEKEEN